MVEVKKDVPDGDDVDFDYAKLKAFTGSDGENKYEKLLGVHLTLHCPRQEAARPNITYFIGGEVEKN